MERPASVLWPDEAIEAMRRAAREILARVGVRVDSPRAAAAASRRRAARPAPPGACSCPPPSSTTPWRRCPPSSPCWRATRRARCPSPPRPTAIFVHNSGEDPNVADPVSGRARPAIMADQSRAARVMHRLRYPQTVNSLFWPSDVPAELQPLYSYLALALETDKHLGSPCIDYGWQLAPLAAMAAAVAGAGGERASPTRSTCRSRRSARCSFPPRSATA